MLKAVIIADDLTGANDTGAIIAQDGFKVLTVLDKNHMNQFDDFDILCISTDSRGISKEEAYERVRAAAIPFKDQNGLFFSKRCDSTLRGNIGAEIDSILDVLGSEIYAVVVASFPSSGRTCVGDYLLVNQVPLEKTEAANDPIAPVSLSLVTEIVKKQSKYSVGYLPLAKVLNGPQAVKSAFLESAKSNRIIVADARTNEDIEAIAKGCIDSGLNFVTIDPGVFTAAVIHELYADNKGQKENKKILCGIGSASALTRRQLKSMSRKYNPLIIKAQPIRFFDSSSRESEINRVVDEIIKGQSKSDILAVVTTTEDADVLDFSKIPGTAQKSKSDCAACITNAMADIIHTAKLRLGDIVGGIYTSGGDISAALCEKIKAYGFDVKDEVVPLAIYSNVLGGDFDQIPIVTKGGLVGDDSTLITCMDYLKEIIQSENR